MIARRFILENLLYKKKFFYLSLLFNFFLSASSLVMTKSHFAFFYNTKVVVFYFVMFAEAAVRPTLFTSTNSMQSRYDLQNYMGFGSLLLMLSWYKVDTTIFITPLLFYRVYHDFSFIIKTKLSLYLERIVLTLGLGGMPLAYFLPEATVTTPTLMVWLASVAALTLFKISEILEKKKTESSFLSSEAVVHLNEYLHSSYIKMIDFGVEEIQNQTQKTPLTHTNNWKHSIDQSLESLANLSRSAQYLDLQSFILILKKEYKESNCRIDFIGWNNRALNKQSTTLMMLIRFFMDLSLSTRDQDGGYIWVTNMPGRISIKDDRGCVDMGRLSGKQRSLLTLITSDGFSTSFGFKVYFDREVGNGEVSGMSVLIILD